MLYTDENREDVGEEKRSARAIVCLVEFLFQTVGIFCLLIHAKRKAMKVKRIGGAHDLWLILSAIDTCRSPCGNFSSNRARCFAFCTRNILVRRKILDQGEEK